MSIPVIDISQIRAKQSESSTKRVSDSIASACQGYGFFMVRNHGVSIDLINEILELGRKYFAKPEQEKMKISMSQSGLSWRGYFPPGQELTSNLPDAKEGLYFGREEAVVFEGGKRIPLTGPNQFPDSLPNMKPMILRYLKELESLAQDLLGAFAIALLGYGEREFFRLQFRDKPTILFRMFNYPSERQGASWGVGEHTDYGFLTLLFQDQIGGLQVKTLSQDWIDVEPLPDAFVVNIGDMLEFWSGGRFIATPHRVASPDLGLNRISMPFFFDPAFDAAIEPIHPDRFLPKYQKVNLPKGFKRWDGIELNGRSKLPFRTYGEYLLHKVKQVFPELAKS